MTQLTRQAGKTAEAFAIVPMDVVEGVTNWTTDQIRRAANRHFVATNAAAIDEKCEKIAGTFWRDGIKAVLPESTQEEILLAMRDAMIDSIIKYYRPHHCPPPPHLSSLSHASPLTYGSKAAEVTAEKRTAEFFAAKATCTSLDEPIAGGKPDSHEITHKDVVNAESELLPANYRGARQIRTTTDLKLIREMMGKGVDWRIFSLRWKYGLTDEALARTLGWTIARLRWHLKGYERRYARLLGVRRRPCARRP